VCAATTRAFRRSTAALQEWTAFLLQVLIAISVELGDDLGRGLFSQHGSVQGIHNAQQIAAFEAAHGFWIEPGWQLFFEHTHTVVDIDITWQSVVPVMNGIYILGHVFVTLGVAMWVYFYRRRFFPLLRNVVIITNVIALFIYESFPVAPPRMTTDLFFQGHPFVFQDTVHGIVAAGSKVVGTNAAYNEFSAMPSIHMAWAMIAGGALVLLARPYAVRLFGSIYPALMLVSVVVTGNHFLLDAVGALCVVVAAFPIALVIEMLCGRMASPFSLPWVPKPSH
jgi:hypothetical protein